MKNLFILTLTAIMLVSTTMVAPKKAQAVDPATVGTVIGVVSAVGLGIWTIYELVVVGDELSASTSEFSGQVYNKREHLEKVQDDAFAYLAGEAPSAILMKTLEESRRHLDADLGNISDKQLAKAAIKYAQAEMASL